MALLDGAGASAADILANATSIVVIPTGSGQAFYTERVRLDGADYNLEFKWNTREARWYLNILDSEQSAIVCGLVIMANWPLLRFYKSDARMPPGELFALDRTGDGSAPGFDELGTDARCQLTYVAQVT